MPRVLGQPSNLSISSFVQADQQPALVAFVSNSTDSGRFRLSTVNGDALAEALQRFVIDDGLKLHAVHFHHATARVAERTRKVTVVCQNEYAAGVIIKPAHRHHSNPNLPYVVGDRRSPLGIAHRANDPSRLVEHDVSWALLNNDATIHRNALTLGINNSAELCLNLAVNSDATCGDQRLGPTS